MTNKLASALDAVGNIDVEDDLFVVHDTSINELRKATPQNVLDAVLGGVYNVKHYGAVGDGSTDDRAAISSTIAAALAALPATVYFPPGNYVMSNGLGVEPAQGADGLTIKGEGPSVSRITFSGASAFTAFFAFDIEPSVTPTVGTYSQYLNNVTVEGLGFYDDDPATHAGTDQTHSISIGYCNNAIVRNCSFDSIGDEAVSFKYVRGGEINGVKTINTPALGTDSGAITVQHGSAGISLTNMRLFGSATEGTQSAISGSAGVHLEIVSANDIEDISITNSSIKDFARAAIQLNNAAAADIDGVEIMANTMRNCDEGVRKTGTSGTTRDLNVAGNVIKDMQAIGLDFDAGKTNTEDLVLSNNLITNCTTAGMKLQVTGAELSNNRFKNCTRGIHIFNGDEINIVGGTFTDCGGSILEEIEVETGTNITAKGVKILNSSATSANIKGVQTVEGCEINNPGAINQENRIFGVTRAIGNKVNGGLRFASVVNVVAEGNELGWNDTGTVNSTPAILVASANDDARIQNNTIDMSGSSNNQYCIDINSGASNTLVLGNNLKSLTAGQANAFNDSGTGTVADFTNNNIST